MRASREEFVHKNLELAKFEEEERPKLRFLFLPSSDQTNP